jgi:GT2 family glycosyltransferase
MNSNYSKTLCIVLHYGSEDYTNKCISSLLTVKFLDIVVSDNDLSQSYKPPVNLQKLVKIIKTGGGVGFSKANNIAVNNFLTKEHSSILLLNNDTFVKECAIDYLRDTLSISNVGSVGPSMPYASEINKIWACGGFISKFKVSIGGIQVKNSQPYEVDYLPGAAILCRSNLWKEIGGLSEKYFFAYEEAEFSLEIKKRGYKVIADPRSIIFHHVGLSSKRSLKNYYNEIRNRLIFSEYLYGRNIGFIYAFIVTIFSFFKFYSSKELIQKFKIWFKAISDHLKKYPIKEMLESINKKY